MIEIDQLFWSAHPKKKNKRVTYAFFFTAERSDEILEVGGIESSIFDFCCN